MGKNFKTLVVLLVVAVAASWLIWGGGNSTRANSTADAAKPGVPVSTAPVARRDVPVYLAGLGNVQAFNSVTVRPQVDGQLRQIAFTEGQTVKTGDILAQIDSRGYQAALDQVIAKRAQDLALLNNARNDMQRYAALVEKNYVARQQLDTTRAQVAQLEAAVQGDDAAIENARVTLGYTTIRSPIDGRVGIRAVDVGNILHAADPTGIVTVTQVKPITVIFTLPEDSLLRVVKAGDAPPVTVVNRDGEIQLDQGVLQLIDNQIDQTTGTVRLKAVLPNEKGTLWPGQFVNVKLRVGVERDVVTIPVTAVQRGQDGSYCFVVKTDGTVEVRRLKLGEISEGVAVIHDGLADGEQVVTAGQYRLQQGVRVEVKMAAGDKAPQSVRE